LQRGRVHPRHCERSEAIQGSRPSLALDCFVAALLAKTAIFLLLVQPAAAETVVRIGVINSLSGFLAQPGDLMDKGISLYAREHEGELPAGVRVDLLKRDDASTPDVGKRLAQRLIARDHVQMLLGVVSSPIAAAIAPLATEAKLPFILTNASGAAIPRLSPYIVRVSFTQWHTCYPLGRWVAEQGWKKGFTAVSDFIPGHDAEAAFTKSFTEAGGTIAGSLRFPTSTLDFAPFVERIRAAAPDVAFLWVPGGQQGTAMVKAVTEARLREAGIRIVSTQDLVPDEELPNMGDAAVGIVSAGTYSTAAERPANVAFLAAWRKAYPGTVPDYVAVGGWDGMAAAFAVIKATGGSFSADDAMRLLARWRSDDSPRGPIMIDPSTRDIVQNVYIRRTERRDGHPANLEFATIPAVKDPWKELNPPH
jgi:branched-chain amino acid transport system substrate-binding protein